MIDLGLVVFIIVALVLLFLLWDFAVWLIVTTLIGAVILFIAVEVFNVGAFSWWLAFLVGIMVSFIGWLFAPSMGNSSGRVVKTTTVEYEEE